MAPTESAHSVGLRYRPNASRRDLPPALACSAALILHPEQDHRPLTVLLPRGGCRRLRLVGWEVTGSQSEMLRQRADMPVHLIDEGGVLGDLGREDVDIADDFAVLLGV